LTLGSYSEAIDILYADNTFDFSELMGGLHDVLKFALLIPTERMQLIKSVKWLQVYSQGGSRIFGDRFGYEGTLARKVWEDETPWLVCRSPLTCSCIACMPEDVYKDTRVCSSLQFSKALQLHLMFILHLVSI
jgi:hypothetical protein